MIGAVVFVVALSSTRSTETWRSRSGGIARNAELTEAILYLSISNLHPWEEKLVQIRYIQPFSRDQKRDLCKLNGQGYPDVWSLKQEWTSQNCPAQSLVGTCQVGCTKMKEILQYYTILYILYYTIRYDTIRCDTIRCDTTLYLKVVMQILQDGIPAMNFLVYKI